ncbi:hypothetical protein ACFWFF_34725 [Streptomyces sp. NPDC060223]|uniref:hypothetical protein n=1 Tax=unclassified Streptomyces TaxID=2593676 RepID=UPI0036445E55
MRQADVLVVSPAAHAAVMAAAATLELADVSTLHRDQDILVPTALLVLPLGGAADGARPWSPRSGPRTR